MALLIGRGIVKRHANVNAADTQYDALIDAIRQLVSEQVEEVTGRRFEKAARTEFFRSYDQSYGDPEPQWIFPSAWPIAQSPAPTLTWAPYDDHDANGTDLELGTDWQFVLDDRTPAAAYGIRVQRLASFPLTIPIPAGAGTIFTHSATGFRLQYEGGYDSSGDPDDPNDPCDVGEANVVQVPSGLQALLAQKAATDLLRTLAVRGASLRDLASAGRNREGMHLGLVSPWPESEASMLRNRWGRADLGVLR